ncbi:hypothetical protein GOV07_00940, partial [Candidatus Woesearchaeota archaeon]|nr:hypothetical protein [Candidatus Woesearchaeota archaeon]
MSVSWGLLFLALLLCMPSVTALGLSYEYLEDKTLELGPGENYFFKLIFQNDEDEDVRIQVTLNSDIAELVGDAEITIPEQTYDSFVYFDIKVPKEAASGDTFSINYEVLPLKDGEGQVPFSVKYSRSFRVLVVDKVVPDVQTPSDMNLVARNKVSFGGIGITLLLLVVITALIVLIWRRSELLTGHFTPRQRAPKTLPVQKPP